MKLPRDLGATELIAALGRVGYQVTRQTGSHVRGCCSIDSRFMPNAWVRERFAYLQIRP